MANARKILSGLFMISLALLGMYCSIRAMKARHEMAGGIDFDNSMRDWSTGASACFVACGAIAVSVNRKPSMNDGASVALLPWWRSPIGITVWGALGVVIVAIMTMLAQRPARPISPPALLSPPSIGLEPTSRGAR